MTVAVWAVILMLFGHWVFDFVLQPHWMGITKSKNWWVLGQHAFRITVGGVLVTAILAMFYPINADGAIFWALLNGLAHFGIDAVTSRITSRLYAEGKTHGFFTVIGFDQFLHLAFAVLTLAWLVF
jgi:hypothetical protein